MGKFFNVAAYRNKISALPVLGPVPAYIRHGCSNLSDLGLRESFPPANPAQIIASCPAIGYAVQNQKDISEPYWHAVIGVAKYAGGEATAHEWSREHPQYSLQETKAKCEAWKGMGPTRCDTLNEHNPQACAGCKNWGQITSPIALGYTEKAATKPAPPLPRLSLEFGLIGFSESPPPARDYCLRDLIIAAKACLLAGFGGVSKTQWLIQFAACTALGLPYMGKATVAGCVVLLLGEEDEAEIARRFNAVARVMKLTSEQIVLVQQRVRAFPMVGLDMRLTRIIGGSLEATEFAAEIMAAASMLAEKTGVPFRWFGLDHAGLLHGGEFNSREDVVQTMRQVNHIANESGAAVLVLAHSPKASANAEKASSADVAGSSAWVDLARGALVLRAMDEKDGKRYGIDADSRSNFVALHVVKNNYGPTGDTYWFKRVVMQDYGVGLLEHLNMQEATKQAKGNGAIESKILEFLRLHPGQYSKYGLRDTHHGTDGPFKASKKDVTAALEALLSSGQITTRAPTDQERSAFGLHQTVKSVLAVKI